ncbi:MAG: Hsp20/alpha crystallin family protein [Bacteroidia bacterium]|nr:Hsp20/alpha crystallin family protein [Bacteroidia bacterium]
MLTKKRNESLLPSISAWMDDWFDRDFNTVFAPRNNSVGMPKVNIEELDDEFKLELAAPGLKKSDFNIELENGILTISCEVSEESETKEENYTRQEFNYHSFRRSFSLPDSIDPEKIKAEYKDGILELHLPKLLDSVRKAPRKIEIR